MFAMYPWKEKEKARYPMAGLRDEFKALYDRFFGGWPVMFEPAAEAERFWGLEMKNEEKELVVRAEVPGFETKEVEVELIDNRLMIRAEKKPEAEEKKPEPFTRLHYEQFVELPFPVAPEKVTASYRNGVLEVHLPKTEEAKPKRIPVQ